jgi:hypothetical protein
MSTNSTRLIPVGTYYVCLADLDRAEDDTADLALRFNTAADAVHAAIEPATVTASRVWPWRRDELAVANADASPSPMPASVAERLHTVRERLLEIVADLDAAAAALRRQAADIDEDRSAALTWLDRHATESHQERLEVAAR